MNIVRRNPSHEVRITPVKARTLAPLGRLNDKLYPGFVVSEVILHRTSRKIIKSNEKIAA